jgi:hypothetical protein
LPFFTHWVLCSEDAFLSGQTSEKLLRFLASALATSPWAGPAKPPWLFFWLLTFKAKMPCYREGMAEKQTDFWK